LRNDLMEQVKTSTRRARRSPAAHGRHRPQPGGLLAKLTATTPATSSGSSLPRQHDALNIDVSDRNWLRSNFFFSPCPGLAGDFHLHAPSGHYQNTSFVQNF